MSLDLCPCGIVGFASRSAPHVFGDTPGSTYVGLAAAGALVFVREPPQRFAEQGPGPAQLEVAYKAAVRAAMKDGAISSREERHLTEIVRALRIDPVHAHDWRDEVRREATPDATEVGR